MVGNWRAGKRCNPAAGSTGRSCNRGILGNRLVGHTYSTVAVPAEPVYQLWLPVSPLPWASCWLTSCRRYFAFYWNQRRLLDACGYACDSAWMSRLGVVLASPYPTEKVEAGRARRKVRWKLRCSAVCKEDAVHLRLILTLGKHLACLQCLCWLLISSSICSPSHFVWQTGLSQTGSPFRPNVRRQSQLPLFRSNSQQHKSRG